MGDARLPPPVLPIDPTVSQANQATRKNLLDDREAMKQSIRGLRSKIEQLAGERERAEKDSLEHTRLWQERAEGLKAQGLQVKHANSAASSKWFCLPTGVLRFVKNTF